MWQNLLKKLISDSALYGVSSMVTKLVAFFTVPIFTSVLSEHDYGVISLTNAFVASCGALTILGMDNAAHTFFWATDDQLKRKKTLASWFWTSLSISIILAILIILGKGFISRNLYCQSSGSTEMLIVYTAIIIVTSLGLNILQNFYRMSCRPVAFVCASLLFVAINIALAIYFVVVLKMGFLGNFLALCISHCVVFVFLVVSMRSILSLSYYEWQTTKTMLKFSLPLFLGSIPLVALPFVERNLISIFSGSKEVGLYQVAIQVSQLMAFFTMPIVTAWGPFALSIQSLGDRSCRIYAAALSLLIMIFGSISFGLVVFMDDLYQFLVDEKFHRGINISRFYLFCAFIQSVTTISATASAIKGNSKYIGFAQLMCAALSIVLYIVIIPLLGMKGAAIATVISLFVVPVFVFYKTNNLLKIPYKFYNCGIMLFVVVVACFVYVHFVNVASIHKTYAHGLHIPYTDFSVNVRMLLIKLMLFGCVLVLCFSIGRNSLKKLLINDV